MFVTDWSPKKCILLQLQVKAPNQRANFYTFTKKKKKNQAAASVSHKKWWFCFIFNLTALEGRNERMQ